jgi:hypothetical protein
MIEVVLLFQPPRHPLPTQQPHNYLCMQSKGGSQSNNRNILSNILGVRGVRQLCPNHVLYRNHVCDPALVSLVFHSLVCRLNTSISKKKNEERMQRITHHVQPSSYTTNLYLSLPARASSKYCTLVSSDIRSRLCALNAPVLSSCHTIKVVCLLRHLISANRISWV